MFKYSLFIALFLLIIPSASGYVCGDVNNTDGEVNLLDILYLIDYIYKGGEATPVVCQADVNNDGNLNILDIIILIEYKYKDGPAPVNCCLEPGHGDFSIDPVYWSIRSYPGGGGVFIVSLVPGENHSGDVILELDADSCLGAKLDRTVLSAEYPVAEITLYTDAEADTLVYIIALTAYNNDTSVTVILDVDVMMWFHSGPSGFIDKMDDMLVWVENNYPEMGSFAGRDWYYYFTYPQIWVVEHWTNLDDDWELRFCCHATIPPDDWSMIRLRRRGDVTPCLAVRRESDGTIYEIPIWEYPIIFGY